MTTTLAPEPVAHTFNSVDLETRDGKKFLRRVIRENETLSSLHSEQWTAHASPETQFTLEFYRRVRGNVGDAEQEIRVRTTTKFSLYYEAGEKQSFYDSDPVILLPCRGVYLGATDTMRLCYFLKEDGVRLSIEGHAGSTSSSKHGIAFYAIHINWKSLPGHGGIQIGSESISVKGIPVCSGSVNLYR